MARAHRHYQPGLVWHVTQRCHKQEFLLKFQLYKKRWLYWLYQAKQRFQISILNYSVTSNHIHLLILSDGEQNDIARTMHLVSGRTAQEYNYKRKRKGAFWEDRYHATAVESDHHLIRCMVYIDMNMVRAGAVRHPGAWPYCGYQEFIGIKQKYTLINKVRIIRIMQMDEKDFQELYLAQVEDYLKAKRFQRESCWTESIAVGNKDFVEAIKQNLGVKARGRCVAKKSRYFELREAGTSYLTFCPPEKVI